MSIKELRESLNTTQQLAKNRHLTLEEFINLQKETNFPDLDAKAFLIARDWALEPVLPKVARKHGLKKCEIQEILQHPLVHAAMLSMRDIYCQHDIVDKAWIQAQRVRALHMAMGDEEIYHIDRNGMQFEGQETNLLAARGLLQDLEKAGGFMNDDIKARPIINVINHGTVNMDKTRTFLDQFRPKGCPPLDSVEDGEFEEMQNEE